MALEIRDRVKETCTGTNGDMTLTGAVSGFVGFDLDDTLDGDKIYYALEDADGTKWEVGLGTLSADSTTLARTTILANQLSFTNTTRQTFSGGTHTIFATYPASKAVYLDDSGNLSHTVDLTSEVTGTLPVANGGTNLTSLSTLLNSNVTPTSLGLVIGTNVQAYDAQLATLAGLTADQVAGLEDLAALEAPASDGQFIVATGANAFAYESGATVRTSLGLGSIATLSSIDISANTNLAGGTGITLTGDTLSTTDSEIVHDNLSGFVANEHIDHSSVSVSAGTGLTGGGTIASNRTLSVDINGTADLASPAVADELLISDADDSNTVKKADLASIVNLADHDALTNFVANEHVDHSSVSVSAGTGLSGGGTIASTRTLSVDINGTADLASPAVADELLISDADDSNTVKKADLASIVNLADHDALTNFVANEHVDHSSVSITTGTGLSGGGDLTSTRTLSVDASQTQITAVGTLTGLTLDGDKNITPGDGSMIHLDTSTLTDNSTSGSATTAKFASVAFEGPTLAATNSSVTTTDAATVYISAAPTAGTNQTLTNAWALWVDAGNVRFDGSLTLGTALAVAQGGTGATSLNNLITLGTHTTGNYVATIADAGSSRITVANSGAETAGVTLDIADNAVGIAQLAGIARGKIIVGDSSGNPALLAVGSANTVLQSDGSDATWGTVSNAMLANSTVTIGSTSIALGATSTTLAGITALTMASSGDGEPVLTLKTTHTTTASSGELQFLKDAADTEDGEVLGQITFYGEDEGNNNTAFAKIVGSISESDETDEAGKLEFYVAESNGTATALTAGLILEGEHATDGEIDVTIGAGAASTTTVAGTLTMGSTAALTNAGLVAVANQSGITGLGTIATGAWEATDVAVLHGGTGASNAADARSNLGITYANIGTVDISANTNLAAGTNISLSGDTLNVDDAFLINSGDDTTSGTVTMANLIVGDGGNIGSASVNDAITIAAEGDVTFKNATKPAAPTAASGTSGIVVLNCDTTNHFTITTGGNITGWNFTNASPGQRIIVRVTNGASHTVGFSATGDGDVVRFPGGTTPTLTTSGGIDVYGFLCIAADNFDGFIIGQALA